jgi:hypothetical protein
MSCQQSADAYREMIEMLHCRPETARSVLNNSLKTAIIATFNLREWRHVFAMRCAKPAHPHIKEIMIPLMMYFKEKFPGMFDDIPYDEEFYNRYRLYLDSHVHEKWSEIIPPYHEEEPSPIIQALVKEENVVEEPEVDHKPIVIDSESETTRPLYTESSEPIEPMDYDEEVTLSSVVNKDASSNPTKDESNIVGFIITNLFALFCKSISLSCCSFCCFNCFRVSLFVSHTAISVAIAAKMPDDILAKNIHQSVSKKTLICSINKVPFSFIPTNLLLLRLFIFSYYI